MDCQTRGVTEPQREVWSLPGYWLRQDTALGRYANRILLAQSRASSVVAAPDNPTQSTRKSLQKTIKNQSPEGLPSGLSGAATRIRTGDLILTKDVLYQLSHSSISQEYFLVTQTIIAKNFAFVNMFSRLFLRNLFFYFKLFKKSVIQKTFYQMLIIR